MPDTAIGWGFRNRIATQYGDRFANDTGMFLRMLAGNPHAEIKITYSFDSLCSYGGGMRLPNNMRGNWQGKNRDMNRRIATKFHIEIRHAYTLTVFLVSNKFNVFNITKQCIH